jgi:uncharacterized membrane protein
MTARSDSPRLPAEKAARPRWWSVPVALVALAAFPVAAGAVRLVGLGKGGTVTADNARFFAAPMPVVLHILGVTLFSLLGAFQFSAEVRRRWPRWHRVAGRVALIGGLVAGLSGLWMTAFYPLPAALQGSLLFGVRMIVGTAMFACLVLAVITVRRGDIAGHSAWMIRGYALGMGAGTQVLLMLPWTLAFGLPTDLPYEVLMTLAWVLNLAVAEVIVRRPAGSGARRPGLATARGGPLRSYQARLSTTGGDCHE